MSSKGLNEKQLKVAIEKLGLDWKTVEKTVVEDGNDITVPNDMSTDKLFVFCKWEMKDQAQALGMKYDFDLKLNYIPKNVSRENVIKLFALEIALYGRHTSEGYRDYKYNIIPPTELVISKWNNTFKIELGDDNFKMKEIFKLFESKPNEEVIEKKPIVAEKKKIFEKRKAPEITKSIFD